MKLSLPAIVFHPCWREFIQQEITSDCFLRHDGWRHSRREEVWSFHREFRELRACVTLPGLEPAPGNVNAVQSRRGTMPAAGSRVAGYLGSSV